MKLLSRFTSEEEKKKEELGPQKLQRYIENSNVQFKVLFIEKPEISTVELQGFIQLSHFVRNKTESTSWGTRQDF